MTIRAIDTMLTGEAGQAAYLLVFLLAAVVCAARAVASGPDRRRGASVAGIALVAASRFVFAFGDGLPGLHVVAAVALGATGLWLAGAGRVPRRLLPAAAGAMLAAGTALAGLTAAGMTGYDPFWFQLVALVDLAGALTAVAAVSFPPPPSLLYVSREAKPPARGLSIASALEINRAVAGDVRPPELFQRIVSAVAADTGASYVLLRLARNGEAHFTFAAFSGGIDLEPGPDASFTVERELFHRVCRDDLSHGNGWSVDAGELGEDLDVFVPGGIEWTGRAVWVAPVMEKGLAKGFLTVGFHDDLPSAADREIFDFYTNGILQVLQRERAAGKIRDGERALAASREEFESVNQLKSNFLSIVSHELRTPLTSVKAYTETLLDNIDSIERGTMRDFLSVMDEEGERIIKLVDNILNYSCMETGLLKVEKVPCNLSQIIEQVHGKLHEQFLSAEVDSDLRLPKGPVTIDADRELLRQLLNNLMSNAVKFTPAGGRVTVTLEEEAAAARIVVQDTGSGIPEDQLDKIFERFHQVDASNTREHGGSGLGLAICKNIVDWHDGQIWVENVKEAGARFVVLLPMKDVVVRQAGGAGYFGSIRFDRERYLSLLVEMVSEILQARKASIMLRQEDDDDLLRIVAAKGLEYDFVQNTSVRVGERIAGRVAESGLSIHAADIEKDLDYARTNNSLFYGTHSFISAPLRDGDRIVGVVNVSDNVEGREYDEADRELLESLALIIVGMLNKLRAYEAVSSNFDKLKDSMRSILEIRETWGSRNLTNLTRIALAVGRRLDIDERSLTALRLGMNLYDLGMMKVPRSIRGKKEELTAREWEALREHPSTGYTLVSPMGLEERIMRMIRCHHEYFDGTGYPDGLAGDEIPIEARIVNVVDSFRALVTPGPYRRCFTLDEARNEIIRGAGSRFDPRVVGAFVKALLDLGAAEDRGEIVLSALEPSPAAGSVDTHHETATMEEIR
ncbi:MAG: GAF domain-containing protein [Candidatus Krumholzibacteriota bacterium]|nr:GAF domain-containing protein [Candidatus Krumholzibacteriota bacterium]